MTRLAQITAEHEALRSRLPNAEAAIEPIRSELLDMQAEVARGKRLPNDSQLLAAERGYKDALGVVAGIERAIEQVEGEIAEAEANAPKVQELIEHAANQKASFDHYIGRLHGAVAGLEDVWTDTTSVAGDLRQTTDRLKALGYDQADKFLPELLPHQAVEVPVALWMALAPQELRNAAADALNLDELRSRLRFVIESSEVPNRAAKIQMLQARIQQTLDVLSALAAGAARPEEAQPGIPDVVRGESGRLTEPVSQATSIMGAPSS